MGKNSDIQWTDNTFNPWWGCTKVSPGCDHCYAESFSKRTGHQVWGKDAPRRLFGDKYWNEPKKWNAEAESTGIRRRVFCASMADVFEDREDLVEPRRRLFELILATPSLDWLLLTKRPSNVARILEDLNVKGTMGIWNLALALPNVWLGTTAENQQWWNNRIPVLMSIPATVHFVSAEPLLGPIVMGELRPDWLIVGGESGGKSRPMERAWVESLRDQCDERTAFFFKQWGGFDKKAAGRELDGRTWDAQPSANTQPQGRGLPRPPGGAG